MTLDRDHARTMRRLAVVEAERDEANERLAAVARLHPPEQTTGWCAECGQATPCQTATLADPEGGT